MQTNPAHDAQTYWKLQRHYQAELNRQNKLGALVLFLDQFMDFKAMEERKQSKRSMARQFAQDVLKF